MKTLECQGDIRFLSARNEVMHAYEDHAKSYQIFNINPEKSTSLEEGLKEMALWVKQVGIRKTPKFQNIEITDKLPAVWMED